MCLVARLGARHLRARCECCRSKIMATKCLWYTTLAVRQRACVCVGCALWQRSAEGIVWGELRLRLQCGARRARRCGARRQAAPKPHAAAHLLLSVCAGVGLRSVCLRRVATSPPRCGHPVVGGAPGGGQPAAAAAPAPLPGKRARADGCAAAGAAAAA